MEQRTHPIYDDTPLANIFSDGQSTNVPSTQLSLNNLQSGNNEKSTKIFLMSQ